jgi:5-methylcytosine-specific restriction endonuclease McrA
VKTCKVCLTEKALSKFSVAKENRDGLRNYCRHCVSIKRAEHYEKNKEKELSLNAQYRALHRDAILEKKRIQTREWVASNLERKRANDKAYERRMREEKNAAFLAQCASKTKKRLVAKSRAIPPWANKEEILKVYEAAAELTKITGVEHHVDHIIPLQGKTVSGLHTHENLQILTATANRSKSNKFVDERSRQMFGVLDSVVGY